MAAQNRAFEDNGSNSCGITRRSFLLGGAGLAAFMLPCLGGADGKLAYALIPKAYADDGQEAEPTTNIIVLSRNEIGIQVYDITDNDKQIPVSGASVTLTSFMEGAKKLQAVTDADGAVVFDISGVSPTVQTGTAGVCYRFEGSATITNGDGYRICTLTKVRIDGGSALALPCCKITDPSIPYFESLSFNQWDMQYFDCTVLRCKEATDKVPLAGRLHIKGVKSVKVSLWAREIQSKKLEEKSLFEVEVDTSKGAADFERKDWFLRSEPTSSASLPLDRTFEIHVVANSITYVFPVQLKVCQSPFQYQHGTATVVPGVTYGQTGTEHTIFRLPSSFPKVLSGSELTGVLPMFPLDVWLSPLGFFFLGAGICGGADANSINGFKSDGFQNETYFSLRQGFTEMADRWDRKFKQYNNMRKGTDPGSSKKFAHKFSAAFGFSISAQASVFADFNIFADPETEKWLGQMAGIIDLYAYASLVEQLAIGPVPCFVSLMFSADARLAMSVAIEAPPFHPTAVEFSNDNSGVAAVITLGIALSIGLGIAGAISASLRGSGSITMYIGLFEPKEPDASVHLVVSAAISADVVLQALMFSWSGKIWGENWPSLYDSWADDSVDSIEGTSQSMSPTGFALATNEDGTGTYHNEKPFASALTGAEGESMNLGEFGKIAKIVTSDQLLKTRELKATALNMESVSADPAQGAPVEIEGTNVFAIPWNAASVGEGAESVGGEDGYSYEYVAEYPESDCTAFGGLLTVADNGGLASRTEVMIVSNAFSNPREKVVVYNGTTIMFRIATVEYTDSSGSSVGRSRLVAQVLSNGHWGRPQVLDIPSGVNGVGRMDMLDCDFDVCVQSGDSVDSRIYQGIYIGMISTQREHGDNTTFYQSAANTILTVAVFNQNLRRLSSAMWRDDPGSTSSSDPSAVTCPRIITLQRNGKPFYVVMSYLRHAASDASSLFSSNSSAKCCVAVPLIGNIVHTSQIEVDGSTSGLVIADAGSIVEETEESDANDSTQVLFSLFLQSSEGTDIRTVSMTLKAPSSTEGEGDAAEGDTAAAGDNAPATDADASNTPESEPAAEGADANAGETQTDTTEDDTAAGTDAAQGDAAGETAEDGSGNTGNPSAAAAAVGGAVVSGFGPSAEGGGAEEETQSEAAVAEDARGASGADEPVPANTPSGADATNGITVEFKCYKNLSNPLTGFNDMKPWPGHASFLSLEDGRLKEFSYNPLQENQQIGSSRMVSPTNISFSTYKISDNGNVLFYAENVEGDESLPFDEEGKPAEPQPVQRYRIMASIYVDGLFSEPFPLVETQHPLDTIQSIAGGASYNFVFTSFTSVANSMADMYYLNAPVAAAATVLGVAAELIFALQGEKAAFILSARNDGNVILTGCTATLHDAETGMKVDSAPLPFDSETICSSVWSSDFDAASGQEGTNEPPEAKYSDEDVENALAAVGLEGPHLLADSDLNGVLIPGRSAQYRVSFTIPADWHGTKNVYVSLSDFTYRTVVSTAPENTEALPFQYVADHENLPRTSVDIHFADDVYNPGMSVPPVGVLDENGQVVYTDGGGNVSSDGKDKIVGLSDTGDPLGLGVVGLAAGAAAAAVAAYSARRTSLERERAATGEGAGACAEEGAGESDEASRG